MGNIQHTSVGSKFHAALDVSAFHRFSCSLQTPPPMDFLSDNLEIS